MISWYDLMNIWYNIKWYTHTWYTSIWVCVRPSPNPAFTPSLRLNGWGLWVAVMATAWPGAHCLDADGARSLCCWGFQPRNRHQTYEAVDRSQKNMRIYGGDENGEPGDWSHKNIEEKWGDENSEARGISWEVVKTNAENIEILL